MASPEELRSPARCDPDTGLMWLGHDAAARAFDVGQLRRSGVPKIFTSKRFPLQPRFLSARADRSLDTLPGIGDGDVEILNAQNWHGEASQEAWDVANRHFRVAFLDFDPPQIEAALQYFDGALVMRCPELPQGSNYAARVREHLSLATRIRLRESARRVWFAMTSEDQLLVEDGLVVDRAIVLPAGLHDVSMRNDWRGDDSRVLLLCPCIGVSDEARELYDRFVAAFGRMPYVVGGYQPVTVNDPQVVGDAVPVDDLMRSTRVLCDLSRDPRRFDASVLEAIRAGIPVVFLAGGFLDRFGGRGLPGRCANEQAAKGLAQRLLDDDTRLVDSLRTTQSTLLAAVDPERSLSMWRSAMQRIGSTLPTEGGRTSKRIRRYRIAVVLPAGHRGDSLRAAVLLAKALHEGSRRCGQAAEVVVGFPEGTELGRRVGYVGPEAGFQLRSYQWKVLPRDDARRALAYAGIEATLGEAKYALPDDRATHFADCDFWIIASDRLSLPLLPIRPYAVLVHDYLQRYERFLDLETNASFIGAQHRAERVFVTTRQAERDALDYAGLPRARVRRLPMLFPVDADVRPAQPTPRRSDPFFVWHTAFPFYKNHSNAADALAFFYDKLDGRLSCCVTGVDAGVLLEQDQPHLARLRSVRSGNRLFRRRVAFVGDLQPFGYGDMLREAHFLWQPGKLDEDLFGMVDAAHMNVPTLGADYPLQREIAEQAAIPISLTDFADAEKMALDLKRMEVEATSLREGLAARSATQNGESDIAVHYWREVTACL
jgi:glycosyltransferase involved in cell wall biosynthesis